MNNNTPQIYGQLKLHKPNKTVRPITAAYCSPMAGLDKFINDYIRKLGITSPYSVRNSIHLTDLLEKLTIDQHSVMVSFDIENLYPSIPTQDTLNILEQVLSSKRINPVEMYDILTITKHLTSNNFAQFNDRFYRAEDGLPMGMSCSGVLAEVFLHDMEKKIMQSYFKQHIIFYGRYVDDIIVIWNNQHDIQDFHDFLNSIDDRIRFTIELESQCKLNFLDITIERRTTHFLYNIYRKPTNSNSVIPADSHHSFQHKLAAFKSMLHRATILPLTQEAMHRELDVIHYIAKDNGFDRKLIDILHRRQLNKLDRQRLGLQLLEVPRNQSYRSIRHTPYNYPFINIFKENGITLTSARGNSLGDMLCNAKAKTPKLERSGVYQLACDNCPAIYIGETGRQVAQRIKEHLNPNKHSAFGKHLTLRGHTLNMNTGIKILHQLKKSHKMTLLESYEIKKAQKKGLQVLNEQLELDCRPIYDYLSHA